MLGFINPVVVLIATLTVAISGGVGYYFGYDERDQSCKQEQDKEKARVAQAVADELVRVREKEASLQTAADRLRKDTDEALRAANARAEALADSLRNRPQRPAAESGVPPVAGAAGAAEGCTGSQLYREDGTAFVGEARLANEVQKYLRLYYEAYKEARK